MKKSNQKQESTENLETVYNEQWIADQYTSGWFGCPSETEFIHVFKSQKRISQYGKQLVEMFNQDEDMRNDLLIADMKILSYRVINYIQERI